MEDREIRNIVLETSVPFNSGGYYDFWSIEADAIHLSKKLNMKVKLRVTPDYSVMFDRYSQIGQEPGNMQGAMTNWNQRERDRIAYANAKLEREPHDN